MTDKPSNSALLCKTDKRGVTRLTLNRPDIHNAFDDALISEMTQTLTDLAASNQTRVLVLQSNGKNFSAGADLNWMKRTSTYTLDENKRDAVALATMMNTLDKFPAPTIAVVQGAAMGGGVGLTSCCDIAIAADRAFFALSEVKLGLIPAAISPFVINAIGQRASRRYFLTAERFDATTALELGLVHEVRGSDALSGRVDELIDTLLESGPAAQREAKKLLHQVAGKPYSDKLLDQTASHIAKVRASNEGREGVTAFLEKRKPDWNPPS